MEGVINVLKPAGMTSHDVINHLRRLLKIKKIGHSGTLDPAATGVLPAFIGKATKAIEFFMEDDKEYIAEMRLGVTTDTGDFQGNITKIYNGPVKIEKIKFEEVLKEFTGEIMQIPPMYSAVHYKGKRLYELARQGITVERRPRKIYIYSIDLLEFDEKSAIINVACSKGTYIRTLCEDIGNKLGCGACLSDLIRTRSGSFKIEDSLTLEEIQQNLINNTFEKVLIPIDQCLQNMPMVILNREDNNFFIKGKVLYGDFDYLRVYLDKFIRVYNFKEFLGIAVVKEIKNRIALQVFKALKQD
ncbi:MAG: tRNA pseudouridine(55) synthase TruB [Tepidanaerobacter acetatoxydans]|uniref:tRNA pseudouridine(55) synthase TruB n=1 Tax=Tepidanaerobacter TaxID=499228 RepID=UPI000A862416|nr:MULTISPECIES: tRNA pseudouridine(55) synthase TruB [Tepidanaerobacter]NLU09596.1 tRNA pseudouridine(55) synthase TruB [Tepidanaerobacter acetatoxydans]